MNRHRHVAWIVVAGVLVLLAASWQPRDGKPVAITVSAAASLTPAFQEVSSAFEAETGIPVILNFASSGQLTEQIRQGASVDVFASANTAFVDQLEAEGLIIPETKAFYAQGRITLWVSRNSPLKIEHLEDLTKPAVERIAIANPEKAPYGMAAQEALEASGVWSDVSSKLIFGETIAQTLSYAETGEVDVALVALSLSMPSDGRWVLIPADMHQPLDQTLAVIQDTQYETKARIFADFVNSSQGRSIMRRYGFTLPGEELPGSQ